MKQKTVPLFMYACLVDYFHEAEETTIKVYPSIKSIKDKRPCVKQCGIVKIDMTNHEIMQQPDYSAAIKANQDKNKEMSDD